MRSDRQRGTRKTGGRRKGTPNKLSGALKDMILTALDRAGGVAYLVRQSEENPVAFMALLGKVLPQTVAASEDGAPTRWAIVVPPKLPPDETLSEPIVTQLGGAGGGRLEGPPQTGVDKWPSNQNADGRDGDGFRGAQCNQSTPRRLLRETY